MLHWYWTGAGLLVVAPPSQLACRTGCSLQGAGPGLDIAMTMISVAVFVCLWLLWLLMCRLITPDWKNAAVLTKSSLEEQRLDVFAHAADEDYVSNQTFECLLKKVGSTTSVFQQLTPDATGLPCCSA